MTYLPQLHGTRRTGRLRLAEFTPAVLRIQDGGCTPGELQVVSLTGGLLGLPEPLHQGSCVKLMFLTPSGPVLGAAEMLDPVTHSQQPFRFVAMHGEDQRRLHTTIQSSLYPKTEDEEWIEKYRTAISSVDLPRRRVPPLLVGAFTVGLLSLVIGFFLIHLHLLK